MHDKVGTPLKHSFSIYVFTLILCYQYLPFVYIQCMKLGRLACDNIFAEYHARFKYSSSFNLFKPGLLNAGTN